MIGDVADIQRQTMMEVYQDEKFQLSKKLESRKKYLAKHQQYRRTIGMFLGQHSIDENTNTCTWELRLYDQEDSLAVENALIK